MIVYDAPLVLIVDDDAGIREALGGLLASVGIGSLRYASPGEMWRPKYPIVRDA